MNEVSEININLNDVVIQKLLATPALLLEELQAQGQLAHLKTYLFATLSNKDGGPTYTNFQVKNFSYTKEHNKGKFRISFDIERTYCCSDMESSRTDYIDFDFQVVDTVLKAQAKYFNWELSN